MASLSGHFLDVVRGLPTLVAHRRARAQSARIGAITDRYRRASLATLRIAFASSAVLELVATLSVALVAVTVGVRLAAGGLGLHTALVVLLLAPEAYWPLRRVGAEFHAAAEGVATFERAHQLLSAAREDAGAPAVLGSALVLDDLTVCHAGRTVAAVDHLSASLPARGVTVVSGPSGCGKSTLMAAVAGLLAPTSGTITSEGRAVGGPAWQAQVAWLPQRPHFVAGTIADNLRLAAPDADDDTLWSALRTVALEERVRALPAGLQGPLGEDGTTLSAGERARLALARIVVADRPWVLLDEPTAHLDDLTEQVIGDVIAELAHDRAVVVVAHRPAILALADHVVALSAPDPVPGPVVAAPRPAAGAAPRALPVDPHHAVPRAGFRLSTVLGTLASASGVALTATAGWLIVQAAARPAVLTLLVAIVGVRLFGLARPVLRYAERLLSHDAALALLARRRVEVYDAIVPLTPARLGQRRGDVLTSIVDDVDSVVDRELRVRLPLRTAAGVVVLAAAVATWLTPLAGLLVVAGAGLGGAVAFTLSWRGSVRSERAAVSLRAELSAAVVDAVQSAAELRMWQATDAALDRVAALSDRLGTATRRAASWSGAGRGIVHVSTALAMAGVAVVTARAVDAGSLSAPSAALLVLLPLALAEVVLPVADAGSTLVRTRAAEARLHRLERTAPAVRDTVSVAAPTSYELVVTRARARWSPTATESAEVSMTLLPGDRVAVVGPSGSGKSTLASLLLRFLDPSSGEIALGGVPTRSLALDDVRRLTGLVDDDPHVFATTLVENIRLARPEAADADVETALRQAHLGAWLDTLPDGLHTWLGDGHAQVSGGERARLAIARSLLADQPVLVLDEPAAHLDHATAAALAQELLTGPRTRTVVWITHGAVGLDLVDEVVDLGADAHAPSSTG